jgi:Ca2+-binding RTX toxin-like protein
MKSDGSHGDTNYVASTGETYGDVAQAGAGYSYAYDNTKLAGGVTESKVTYTYANGSTYSTDTIKNPDGSYQQSWTKSDGTAGSVSVAGGVQVARSWLNADGSQGVAAGGNRMLIGGSSNDSLSAGTGNELLLGGQGNDAIVTGAGADIVAFNMGDGQDSVRAGTGQNDVLSLGGNFAYSDLAFQKSGNDLVLDMGASDSMTFKDWYASAANQEIVTLQVIAQTMSDFAPGSSDVLRNANVETFDFRQVVSAFDQARAADPMLSTWSLTDALLNAHLFSSDSAALGGDLAYEYGMNSNLTGFSVAAAESTVSDSQFGTAPQGLHPWNTVNTGAPQLK